MNIALDYDETWTRDPDLWHAFVTAAKAKGHTVYGVTMRYPREGTDMDARYKSGCNGGIFFTSRQAKLYYMEKQDVIIHVWIDDSPNFILMGAR